jgi:serine protease SohB
MKIFGIVLGILILGAFLFIWLRRRRRQRACFVPLKKHPNGFSQYHPKMQIRIKRALKAAPDKKSPSRYIAVFRFEGDVKASNRFILSHAIDEILLNREQIEEVVLLVESPGGSVTDYGHTYSEVARIREAGIALTVCIDTVAASGGYLMSLPASKIMAAPFAMVGSIGVVSFVPNIRRLLEKLYIEPRTFTAGDYKRTVTFTDNATPEQVKRYEEQLRLIHEQFKEALKKYRPDVELSKVATGEAWLASTSRELALGLVDELRVSSDYLLERNREASLIEFYEKSQKPRWKTWLKVLREELARAN